mgnify:FL=1
MSFQKSQPNNPYNPNNSIGLGGSSEEMSQTTNPGFVWGPQGGYLQELYGMGSNLANNFGQYEQAGQGIFNTALGGFNPMMNPGMNPQLQAYQGDVQRNLERNMLPAIQSNAAGFGQMGGSRHGIAQGLALSDANQQVTDMASNLYNDDMNRMMGAMALAPGLANFGMGIPWYALNQYAGLLGSPTALSGGGEASSSGGDWKYQRDIGGGGGGGGGGFNFDSGFRWGL